jgi:hypothetical protein
VRSCHRVCRGALARCTAAPARIATGLVDRPDHEHLLLRISSTNPLHHSVLSRHLSGERVQRGASTAWMLDADHRDAPAAITRAQADTDVSRLRWEMVGSSARAHRWVTW